MPSSQCTAATGEALGHPRRWRHQRRSARLNCWRAEGSSGNELKTKRRAQENIGDENGRREGERETFTKAPSTGLVKETIPAGAEKLDVRAPKESGRKDNAQIPVLLDQGLGNATEVNTAVRAAAQRTENHGGGFWCSSEHSRYAQRQGPSRRHRAGKRDGRSQRQRGKHRG